MALQVWLPLNGDLTNQGLSNVIVTNNGATVDNNGKIGKCYKFNNQYMTIPMTNLNTTNGLTLACWVYPIANASGNMHLVTFAPGAGWPYNRFGLFLRSGTTSIITAVSDGTNTINYNCQSSTLPLNTWTHVCSTYSNRKLTVYLNGVQNITYNITFDISLNGIDSLNVGGCKNGNETLANCKLNDVRFYNHCLSAKEVKELSKGLVLHYRLAGPGQPNLLNGNIHLASAWTQENHTVANYSDSNFTGLKITATQANGRIYNSVSNLWITNNAKYTVSFWAKSDTVGTTIDCSRSLRDFSPTFTLDTNWKYYSGIITTTGVATDGTLSIRINQASRVVYIANIKVENGAIATPFVPPSNSFIYSAMGYNNNIEYDCSGYRRNGTKSGTITWDIDSPRYTTSYKFGSNTSKIKLPAFNMSGFANSYTFSWWQYNIGSDNMPWGFSDGNRLNPYHTGNLCWNTGDGGSNPFVPNIISSTLYNTWHHIVITGNGTDTKLYIDGEYKGKAATYKGLTGTQIYLSGWDTGTSYTMTGSREADFRIYATALSAEDIAELYHSAVIVDNTGKNYAYEYFEA